MKTIRIDDFVDEQIAQFHNMGSGGRMVAQVAVAILKEITRNGDVVVKATDTSEVDLYFRIQQGSRSRG